MNDISDSEKAKRKSEMQKYQFELFSLQSDEKKLERKKSDLEGEVKQAQLQMSRLKVDISLKESLLRSSEREVERIHEEITHVKKLMNIL